MQKLNVVSKLWLAFTVLILVVLVPLELALSRLLTDFYASQVTEPLLYHSKQLAGLLASDQHSLTMAPMMGSMVGGEVLVLDRNGDPVAFEGASQMEPPAQARQVARTGVAFSGHVRMKGHSHIVTAVPVPRTGGAVVLLAPAEPMQRSLSLSRRYLWLAGTGTLILGAGLALMLSRSLLRPIIAIERATVQIARGDFSTRVPVETHDEIAQLAKSVNQMTAQLESYEARRREFLANVAHELRTPLSYIRGYSQAVAERVVPDAERDRYLQIVQEESVRLGRLVDDLMDMAQMDEGQLSFDFQNIDIRSVVEQAVSSVQPLANSKGVAITVDKPDRLSQPLADGGRIHQVAVNLLDNALRHTPEGGRIHVVIRRVEQGVRVSITDTGSGIHPEDLPLVFERFHKRHKEGRGLGLAIVRSIIRAHGGEVGVESPPGQGATFWFRLPIHIV